MYKKITQINRKAGRYLHKLYANIEGQATGI